MMNFIEDIKVFSDRKVNFIYGLAGNPMHIGHVDVIKRLLEVKDAKVHIVLSKKHAFGKNMLPYDVRSKIIKLMLNDYLNKEELSRLILSDIEEKINKESPIYSVDIKRFLEKENKDCFYVWAFGEDNCKESNIKKFKNYEEVVEWDIFKVKENIKVHSTIIRDLVLNNNFEEIEKLTSNSVSSLLKELKFEYLDVFKS